MRVGDLVRAIAPIAADATGAEAYARFADDPHLLAIAVVAPDHAPIGLLTRAGFALKMADRFGRALYEKRPISLIIERQPLLADVAAPLSALNAMILRGEDATLLEGFVAVQEGKYFGVGTGLDVLRATSEAAARTAKGLAIERNKARAVEAALLDLFRSADALAAGKRAALAGKSVSRPFEDVVDLPAPTRLAELVPRIEHLFTEMRARDEALLGALDAAEAANAAKSQFLANTSHELRTPLNAIIGYAEILEEDAVDHHEDGMARDARRISEAGKRLLSLINGILDMSKIEAGKLHVCADEFDLGALIREAVANVAPQARANNVRLHTDVDPHTGRMFTDGMRLRQCLINLLANAVKFTRDGAVVVRAAPQTGGLVRIEIIDTGIGMSAEEMARLFQPFVQASAKTTQRFGGTGLGLAITKRLANMLGGDISVTSAPGLGSCFALVIPSELEESESARAA